VFIAPSCATRYGLPVALQRRRFRPGAWLDEWRPFALDPFHGVIWTADSLDKDE